MATRVAVANVFPKVSRCLCTCPEYLAQAKDRQALEKSIEGPAREYAKLFPSRESFEVFELRQLSDSFEARQSIRSLLQARDS